MAQSATECGRVHDDGNGGDSRKEEQRSRVWDEDEQCRVHGIRTLNRIYGFGSINNQGIKWNRPQFYST